MGASDPAPTGGILVSLLLSLVKINDLFKLKKRSLEEKKVIQKRGWKRNKSNKPQKYDPVNITGKMGSH